GADVSVLIDFATALALGALVGIEREKRQQEPGQTGTAGLRTFILYAEVGAVAGWLARRFDQPWLLLAALAVVAVPVVAGYFAALRTRPEALGLTTEIAALVVCLIGGMTTLGHRELAIGLGIVTAAVLAYKHPLHGLLEKLGWDDVFAGLRLLIATFIVLPLLPTHPVDPWGALTPSSLWLLVILISSLSLIGYVLTRWLGPGRGALLTGLSGGLVSSTAVTLAFARRSRLERQALPAAQLTAGILAAWAVMFGRVLAEVAVVNPQFLPSLAAPFAAMGLASLALVWIALRRARGRDGAASAAPELPLRNPFSLLAAARFAALFAAVLLAVKLAQLYVPGNSVQLVAILAGTTDVDAITLSMADYARTGDRSLAATAIVLATLTNTAVKCGMVLMLGGPALRRPVLLATLLITGVGLLGAWLA
ncbi:MAG TPA: MgtC/SapB family protein, partial [Planctomycetota bacterium]|nr:MgtC/SapB family protein [Planctomycetota bacterium]